jgi:hypothetical protein
LVDIDLDCDEAIDLAPRFLPDTGAIFGRKSKLRSHLLYVCDPLPATKKFMDPTDQATLVEFRSTGTQTIFPPSVRGWDDDKDPPAYKPEQIKWEVRNDPARVSGTDLLAIVSKLAAASLLVKHYPGVGGRHAFSLALCGG